MNLRQPALMLIGAGLLAMAVAAGLAIYSPSDFASPEGSTENQPKACSPPANVSFPAPDLTLSDMDGNLVQMEDLQGQVVLLNAWATWCPPCRAEMPDLEAFHQTYQDRGLRLIGINIGERLEQVQDFVQSHQISFQIWLDPDESTLRAFNTISLPSTFVIDRSGQVRLIWNGLTCFDQLESNVAPLLLDL
jgi:peroxiredoxin